MEPSIAPSDTSPAPPTRAFGTVFAERMAQARYADGQWSAAGIVPLEALSIHPAAHALHYGSSCFEGLKAFRISDERVALFRLDAHLARLARSAELLCQPAPPLDLAESMIRDLVAATRADVPEPPGALYLRPTLIGTEPNIGAAGSPSSECLFYVLASPVGDYFAAGERALTIAIEDTAMRSTPGFGQAKTGANYAAALRTVARARAEHGADQVLFCPGGDVQETGASNFLLIDDERVLTKPLGDTFLHGVTRASLLRLAADLGYEVIERDFTIDELRDWIRTGEAALSGTAAVLAGVGTMIHRGETLTVGDGNVGANTHRLREALTAIQSGRAEDRHGWLS